MGWVLELGATDLAGVRFAVSPLHETITALRLLHGGRIPETHRPWADWVHRRVAEEGLQLPQLGPLILHGRRGWPEFLAPAPTRRAPTLDEELAGVRATDPADVRASLTRVFADTPPPAARRLADRPTDTLIEIAAEVQAAHDLLIAPDWPAMRDLLEADTAHRAAVLADGGLATLLPALHPSLSWRAGTVVVEQGRTRRPVDLGPGGLVLCPTVFAVPGVRVKGATSSQTTLRYPARGIGALWPTSLTRGACAPLNGALARLIGSPRARILTGCTSPASTSTLAARLGVTPSAVSQHLTVLHAAGLLDRSRAGRRVQYTLTPTGRALLAEGVHAQPHALWAIPSGKPQSDRGRPPQGVRQAGHTSRP